MTLNKSGFKCLPSLWPSTQSLHLYALHLLICLIVSRPELSLLLILKSKWTNAWKVPRTRSEYKLVTPVLRRLKGVTKCLRSAWATEQDPASIKQEKKKREGGKKWWEGRKEWAKKGCFKNVSIKITVTNAFNISKISGCHLFVITKKGLRIAN